MPRFITISPTHIPGKKKYAWNNFLKGGYISAGWLQDEIIDLTKKTLDEAILIIRGEKYSNESKTIDFFRKFFSLEIGDYVAANNTNDGLFGIGIVTSGVKFQKYKHDTGHDDQKEFYSHYRDVKWIYTTYVKRKDIIIPGEKGWMPYGTLGKLENEVPPYIKRLLGKAIQKKTVKIKYIVPDNLKELIQNIKKLKIDPKHQERAHESLVEDFYCALGYEKHRNIKYRVGRIDISIWHEEKPILTAEVKKDWSLNSYNYQDAVKQGYIYALEKGAQYVVVTNGDYYALFDRSKGLSYKSNKVGEFKLTALEEKHLKIINKLRLDNLLNSNLE